MIDLVRYGNDLVLTVRDEQDGKTLPEVLEISAKTGYLLQQEKRLVLNHKPMDILHILHKGERITIHLKEEPLDYTPADRACRVVYEDDWIYIAHKDPGIIVHDGFDNKDTFAAQAAAWQARNGIEAPVRYIHRLDRETSGLILFVKHPLFQPLFENMLRERRIHRSYLAVCWGKVRPGQRFHWTDPIGRDRHVNGRYRVSPSGKPAETDAVVLLRDYPFVVLKCELLTGRTHQIRVHTSHAGLLIVNDPLYGRSTKDFPRMGLYAYEMRFIHPFTGEPVLVQDKPDPSLRRFRGLQDALDKYQVRK